jgi:non-lysosomal glucosylceramidase
MPCEFYGMKKGITMQRQDLGNECACSGSCEPVRGSRLTRREFVKLTVSSAAMVSGLNALPIMGEPFEKSDSRSSVPIDKKLSPAWIRSLYDRSRPEVYSGQELKYIGMPVGGIACGQLYIGGDGKLWGWDIFNKPIATSRFNECDGVHYKDKLEPHAIVDQGFAIQIRFGNKVWKKNLDKTGFSDITFRGEYPIATVTYRDSELPVEIALEVFSPFIPLQAKDSSIPATIMSFSVNNISDQPVEITIAGWLENAVRRFTASPGTNHRINQCLSLGRHRAMICSWLEQETKASVSEQNTEPREDVIFEDFEGDFSTWTLEGNAFGQGPIQTDQLYGYPLSNAKDKKLALSHCRDGGINSTEADSRVGQLTSQSFEINRRYITFLIAGGSHTNETCIQLFVEGEKKSDNLGVQTKVLQSVSGEDSGSMAARFFDVSEYQGERARLRIVDKHQGDWGHTAIDHIVFTDARPESSTRNQDFDHGSMGLMLIQGGDGARVNLDLPDRVSAETIFDDLRVQTPTHARPTHRTKAFVGGLAQTRALRPNERTRFDFVITWFYPSAALDNWQSDWIWPNITSIQILKRHYANRYANVTDVAVDVARRFEMLTTTTRQWRDTWYNSTLPYWLLDRIMIPSDCLATQTCAWFDNGRFYGWEGTYCCGGTCTHVWHYAQAMGRLFPELERSVRKHVDFHPKVGQRANGGIGMRGESGKTAVDGHCGRILPEKETRMALNALWKYNYTTDVGPFRKTFIGGRWYAMPGEGGLINCTFPQGDVDNLKRGNIRHAAYFNECWTGYEYQVASHMIFEGTPELVERGLAIIRTAHERHVPIRRNPYNEVECSDHYARAMSAYGALIALCGFEYDGPAGCLGFAPRITPDEFKAPFTTAEGWGTYTQKRDTHVQTALVEIKWGMLNLRRLAFELPSHRVPGDVSLTYAGGMINVDHRVAGQRIILTLDDEICIDPKHDLEVHVNYA